MVFTGFQQHQFPEYEVITPHTHESFTVRTLTVQEEEKLKGSYISPLKITELLNQCIYNVITNKPKHIDSFESFLKNLTIRDREALLFGVHHISYEEIRNYDVPCLNPSCQKMNSVTVNASDIFDVVPYPEEGILQKRVDKYLPVFNKLRVTLKQPTMHDEIYGLRNLGARPGATNDQIISILPIVGIYEEDDNGEILQSFEDKEDILDAYKSLPSRDKKYINQQYSEEFGQYGITLRMKMICQYCGEERIANIDIIENFFSMVYSD